MAGGFNFQVNDGLNFAPRQIFSIMARALVLKLEKAGPLHVFPGDSCKHTSHDLIGSEAVRKQLGFHLVLRS